MTDPRDCLVSDDQLCGFVVVVVRPTNDAPRADAYGPHGEREAHDIATVAARSQRASYLIDLGEMTVERYRGDET